MNESAVDERRLKGRSVSLDLIRGLAAISVLLLHTRFFSFSSLYDVPPDKRNLFFYALAGTSRFGTDGVLVFFGLSGLLVGGQLISSLHSKSISSKEFFQDRASRILPPLIASVVLSTVVGRFFGADFNLMQIIGNMIGLNGTVVDTLRTNGALWSIAYEIWFYVVGWAGVRLFIKGPSAFSVAALSAGGVIFSILDWRYLAYWIVGALAAHSRLFRTSGLTLALGCLLLIIGLAGHQAYLNKTASYDYFFETFELCGFVVAITFITNTPPNTLSRLLSPFARFTSGISYSLYLTHLPINVLLTVYFGHRLPYSNSSILFYFSRVGICTLFAWGFSELFERRLRRAIIKLAGAPSPNGTELAR